MDDNSDLLSKINDKLRTLIKDNNFVPFGLTGRNRIDKLLQTPDLWGHNPHQDNYEPTAKNLTDAIYELLASARHSIDISTLTPLPDGRFLDALRRGIRRAYENGARPVIRIIQGVHYNLGESEQGDQSNAPKAQAYEAYIQQMQHFLEQLDLPADLFVYAASMQSGWVSWNHSKLIVVDSYSCIYGGHNQWTETYCGFAPVHDVSAQITGPAVGKACDFLDYLWGAVASYSRSNDVSKWYWSCMRHQGKNYPNALPYIVTTSTPPPCGQVEMLALGRMGAKLAPSTPIVNASRFARIEAVLAAKSHIRLAQQKLGYPEDSEFMEALYDHVAAGKQLSIIISDLHAQDQNGADYSGWGVAETARVIARGVARKTGKRGGPLAEWLQQHVHIGPVRFYDRQANDPAAKSWMWTKRDAAGNIIKQIEPANHSKVYIVDEAAYYIGSDNAYSIFGNDEGLQEFGFLIGGTDHTKDFINAYWNRFWHYSSQFAFSGWSEFTKELA